MSEATPIQLLARVSAVSDTLTAARAEMVKAKTPDAATAFCQAKRRLAEARAAIPPLTLVVSNG
jgi:hypothetical protein